MFLDVSGLSLDFLNIILLNNKVGENLIMPLNESRYKFAAFFLTELS